MNVVTSSLEKYKKLSSPIKASLWYTFCNLLTNGISFLVIPIYTRILTREEYGMYTTFQSWLNILIILATLNLYCGVFTRGLVQYETKRDEYTSSVQMLSTIITGFFAIIVLCSRDWFLDSLNISGFVAVNMILYFLFFPAFSFWTARQRVEYKYKEMVIVTLASVLLTPLLSLGLLMFTDLKADAVILGFLLSQNIIGAIFYILNFLRGKVFFSREYWLEAIKFNIPLIPHYLSLIVLGQSDRIMISNICGSGDAGLYSLAYQISMAMNIIISAINGSLIPWTYSMMKEKKYSEIRKIADFLCLFMMAISVVIMVVAPEVVFFMGGKNYHNVIWVMPPVICSVFFTFCYGLFSNIEFYFGNTKYVMIASVIGSILNIILNAIFIPIFGFIAAAYTTLFCYFVFMIAHYLFMKRICIKMKCNDNIYSIKNILLFSIVLCLIAFVMLLIYDFMIVRYIIFVCVFSVGIIKKDIIMEKVKKMKNT